LVLSPHTHTHEMGAEVCTTYWMNQHCEPCIITKAKEHHNSVHRLYADIAKVPFLWLL